MDTYSMTRIIDGRRYNTETATLLAHDRYWDGHNLERDGRQCYLFRTPRGNYFIQRLTRWIGEESCLIPVSEEEARHLFETLGQQEVSYHVAFPDFQIEDA